MSSCLVWSPIVKQNENDLPNDLKFVLRKKYGEPINANMDESDIPYINGLIDAGVKGAEELREIIEKHIEVELKEQY